VARAKKTESPPTEPDLPAGTKGPPGQQPSKLMETGGDTPASPASTVRPPDPSGYSNLLRRLENDFRYHAPKEGQPAMYEAIRDAGHKMAKLLVATCPEGRELATALTNIEQAVFWGNAAVARSM
jgi:hypothetical protein